MRVLLVNPPVLAVDPYQVYSYADVIPFGLYQIATLLAAEGHEVRLLDMMRYLEGGYERVIAPANRFATKPAGDASCAGVTREVYLLGEDFEWLRRELGDRPPPDRVLVTCCLTFNWEPAHRVVEECRRAFPAARIQLGGFYATACPAHAAQSGADEVFTGRWPEAEQVFPRLDLCERRPRIWLFKLVSGCPHRCSFCVNSAVEPRPAWDPRAAAEEVRRVHLEYGVEEFCNWDPNVLGVPGVLHTFLSAVASFGLPLRLRFDMGVPPDRLSSDLAKLMRAAGTIAVTLPFESADPELMRRFRKPYRLDDTRRALDRCRDAGLEVSRFHCPFLLGVRGEDLRFVFRTYAAVLASGGKPTPFPLSPTPGTREAETHAPYLQGKGLELLNGHLWPLQGSAAAVDLYDRVLRVVARLDVASARAEAGGLPPEVQELFEEEVGRPRGGAPAATGRAAAPARAGTPGWLHALCGTCLDRAECARRDSRREPDVTRCHRADRRIDVGALTRLFGDLRARAGLVDPALERQEERMWRRLEALQRHQSSAFEPSASFDGRAWNLYRYTFSFHDDAAEQWPADCAEAAAWVKTLDPRARPTADRVLAVLGPPLARQLLFGLDAGTGGARRYKLYFRLYRDAAERKRKLIARVAGETVLARLADSAGLLFMLGFDFAPAGVLAVKLYLRHDEVAADELDARYPGAHPFFGLTSARKQLRRWEEVIAVARVGVRDRSTPPRFTELNTHCLRNDLTWDDLPGQVALPAGPLALGPLDELRAAHPLVLTSLTLPLTASSKANLYYNLVP